MAETLTESFCERCGTRYEFKAPTRLNPLRKTRGFVGGLKNWVTSQDDMSDAMRDAMRQQEESLAAAQLEAFHESFNFCIDCRQYTCVNCWNDGAGRCRSCAPIAGTDDLAERLAASVAGTPTAAIAEPAQLAEDEIQRRLGMDAWPTSDLPEHTHANGHRAEVAWPDADTVDEPLVAEAEPHLEAEPEPEPEPEPMVAEIATEPEREPVVAEHEPEPEPTVVAAEFEPGLAEIEPEPDPVTAESEPAPYEPWLEPEPVVAEAEGTMPALRVVGWDPDTAYEVFTDEPVIAEVAQEAEAEPVVAEAEPEPEPEPVVAEAEPEPEPVVPERQLEPEPEPVVAEAEAEAEPVMAEPEPPRPRIAPIGDTILRFPSRQAEPRPERQAAEDESPEVAARRAQLDLLGLGDPGEGPVEQTRPAVLPYRSRGAAAGGGQLSARATQAGGSTFWEASAREVAGASANIGVQSCGQCGLSLSANARFCRRCGTRQAQSA